MRGLSVKDLCGEIRHFQKLGRGKTFSPVTKFMSVKIQLFCAFLSSRNVPIL